MPPRRSSAKQGKSAAAGAQPTLPTYGMLMPTDAERVVAFAPSSSSSSLAVTSFGDPSNCSGPSNFASTPTSTFSFSFSFSSASASSSSTSGHKRKENAIILPLAENGGDAAMNGRNTAAQQNKRTKYEENGVSMIQLAVTPYGSIDWSQRLPADWFGLITSFLDLPLLSATLRTCQTWLKYTHRVAPRLDQTLVLSQTRCIKLIPGRHYSYIRKVVLEPELDPQQMGSLRYHFPQLTDLTARINIDQYSFAEDMDPILITFPPHLRNVSLALSITTPSEEAMDHYHNYSNINWKNITCIIDRACAIPTLTSLRITDVHGFCVKWGPLMPKDIPMSVFEALLQAKDRLTSLALFDWHGSGLYGNGLYGDVREGEVWSSKQVKIIRQLTKLTSLDIPIHSEKSIAALLAAPLPYQLEYFSVKEYQLDSTKHKVAFPLLTQKLRGIKKWRCYDLIQTTILQSHFVSLEDVFLRCGYQIDANTLVQGLSQCAKLHSLVLGHGQMTSEQLTILLSLLPHIQRLALISLPYLADLSFARTVPHLAETLHQLAFHMSPHLTYWNQDPTLSPLTALRNLRVFNVCQSEMSESTSHSYTPSSPDYAMSKYWPYFRKFTYVSSQQSIGHLPPWSGFEEYCE